MRNTKNRKKLIQFLNKGEKAYTAKEIHRRLPDMDLATIYRNLNIFVKEGIVRELRITKGESLYEINDDDHDHAVCTRCGKVKHVKIDKAKLVKNLELEGFDIDNIEINIKGTCNDPSENH